MLLLAGNGKSFVFVVNDVVLHTQRTRAIIDEHELYHEESNPTCEPEN